jgi:hypothetical protein
MDGQKHNSDGDSGGTLLEVGIDGQKPPYYLSRPVSLGQ